MKVTQVVQVRSGCGTGSISLFDHSELRASVDASGSRAHVDRVHREFAGWAVMMVNFEEQKRQPHRAVSGSFKDQEISYL